MRWRDLAGTTYLRDYEAYLTPPCQKFYKDNNYGNTITLWDGGNSNKVILISEGFDAYNTTYSEYLRYKGKDLFDALLQDGYKIYFLNFSINGQDMRNLAAIYNSASRYVSSLNSNTSMIAAGISMGGVVVRYALAKADGDGNSLPFSKFLSIDAPQQGAILDEDFQNYFKDNVSGDFETYGLNNTAAKEILNYNTYGSLKDQFYNELKSLNNGVGYPTCTENIGISFSNGSPNPSTGNWLEVVFRGTLLPTPFVITKPKYFAIHDYEQVAGSYLPASITESGPSPLTSWKYIIIVASGLAWTNRYSYSNPTFIAYTSALDIVNGNSKFDRTMHANANYFHDQFPPEIIDQLLDEFNISYTMSGTLQHNETWFGTNQLQGNVFVPTGITLTIPGSATINLINRSSRYSIISTGGTINCNGTVNGLRARLTANLTLRGLCGTIQAAASNANGTNEIFLADGNFNENVNIYNKYNLAIFGNENYNPFGSLTVTSCTAFQASSFGAKNIYISNSSYLVLHGLEAYETNQSTIGFYFYNSDTYDVAYLTSEYSRLGISCWDGTDADIEESSLYDNLAGVEAFNGSNVTINNSFFCGTALDLTTYNFSSIHAYNCFFDGGNASTSGSNIIHMGDQSCSLSKAASNQITENNTDNIEGSEFEKINSAYFSLNKKLSNAFKEKTAVDKEAFCTDYDKVIKDFKGFIDKNPKSPLAKVALVASAKSYHRIDDLRGKNNYADMKGFLSGILENSEYAELKPQVERLMMEYYRLTKDFTTAIETVDNLIKNYKEDADYICGVLYAKGLIESYDLNQPDKSAETFSNILQQYPGNSLAVLAENQLRILGQEVVEPKAGEGEITSNEIELNNYPNPFNPTTIINYSLPKDEKVVIKVYDILGREVETLVNDFKAVGKYSVQFDGRKLSSGVYTFSKVVFGN